MWQGFCLGKTRGGDADACGKVFVLAKRAALTQVLGACGKGLCLSKMRGADAGACGKGFCLGKTRGGDADACGKVFVLAKRAALTQVLGACGKVFVLAKCVALTQVLVARFLSWQNAWR